MNSGVLLLLLWLWRNLRFSESFNRRDELMNFFFLCSSMRSYSASSISIWVVVNAGYRRRYRSYWWMVFMILIQVHCVSKEEEEKKKKEGQKNKIFINFRHFNVHLSAFSISCHLSLIVIVTDIMMMIQLTYASYFSL